ncbi:uncharacterized protein BDW43DRAFT_306605 [Aspergillus alliaceus]|uniref:uncharacterized protein n=1 Tax=Petromyces alliaceus TaxID=209559 RepID=UPI0012A4F7E8|nr:uncharacterized protein BDW43DRAFT_306605 [Aspergillus alliaceus]KAB8237905.1 hypothetical protein BDW43DRAFT_306605 [Aspergillus alliaceus]
MIITYPTSSVNVDIGMYWHISWQDASDDPKVVDFWLTHERRQPEYKPVLLAENVNAHEQQTIVVKGDDSSTIKTDSDYRVWAMKQGEKPMQNGTHPVAESDDFSVTNKSTPRN